MWRDFRERSVMASMIPLFLEWMGMAGETRAQALYGSVVGAVTDSAHSSVAGATVRLTNIGTNQTRETVSDENGNFIFTSVPGGTYSVSVKKWGFKPTRPAA